MMSIHFLTPETRAEIANRIFGAGLMDHVRTMSDNDAAFAKVAEKAVSAGVSRYQWLTRLGFYHRADNGSWHTSAEEYADLRRQRSARNRVRKIARKHGEYGKALLYAMHLEAAE